MIFCICQEYTLEDLYNLIQNKNYESLEQLRTEHSIGTCPSCEKTIKERFFKTPVESNIEPNK